MEVDPGDADTFVFSVHHDVMASLVLCPYEAAMLFYLAMEEHDLFRDGGRGITNIGVCMILLPLGILTPREHQEAIDRLVARGFVHLAAPGEYFTDPLAARVQHRRELPAQFLMQWNDSAA